MLRKNQRFLGAGDFDDCDRDQPSDEFLEVWQDGGTIERIPASEKLVRVLIVDDCRDVADALAVLVESWGHGVRRAYSGTAALEMISAYQPDVLILDLAMPGMDGCDLARHLRRQARWEDALLVAVTGHGDAAHRQLCEEAGFDLILVKPVEPSIVETLLLLEQDRLAEIGRSFPRNS